MVPSPSSSLGRTSPPPPMFVIGAEVTTQYGHGRVSDVRQDGSNQKIVVLLDAWKLTGKSFVTCYLQPHSVALYVPKTLHEMNLNEKVEYAKKMRAEGKHHYACRDHGKSLVANTKAVDAVRSVLRGYSRSEVGAANRANLLVLKVDALNDAAACSVALEIYEGAEMFARRALQLIDTLDDLRNESADANSSSTSPKKQKRQSEQQLCGNLKIFGQWRVRSYTLIAEAMIRTKRERDAVYVLDQGTDVIARFAKDRDYMSSRTLLFHFSRLASQATKIQSLRAKCLKLNYVIGTEVTTPYGRGRVKALGDEQMAVILTDWRLARGSSVVCYLNYDCVSIFVPKTLAEMSLEDKVERARAMKVRGASEFVAKDYAAALGSNTRAVDAVRSILRTGLEPGELRSSLLILKVDALNEAAACSNHLGVHESSEMFARRALQLTDILEQTHRYTPLPKVNHLLGADVEELQHMSEVKLFGEWRVRSYVLIAEALIMTKEDEKARLALDAASDIIYQYTQEERMNSPVLVAQTSLVKELRKLCKVNRKKRHLFQLPISVFRGSSDATVTTASDASSGADGASGNSPRKPPRPSGPEASDVKQKRRSVFYGLNPFRKGRKQKEKMAESPEKEGNSEKAPPLARLSFSANSSAEDDGLSEGNDTFNTQPVENAHFGVEADRSVEGGDHPHEQQPTDFSVVTQKRHGGSKSMFTLHMNLGDGRTVSLTDAGALVKQLDESQRAKAKAHIMALQAQLSELHHMIDTEPLLPQRPTMVRDGPAGSPFEC